MFLVSTEIFCRFLALQEDKKTERRGSSGKKQKSIAFYLAFGTFYTRDTHKDTSQEEDIIMDPQLLNSLPEEDKTKMVAMIETMQTRDR